MYKLFKLSFLEVINHLLSVILSMVIAKKFGVIFKGELALLTLSAGFFYLLTFSGFKNLALKLDDSELNEVFRLVFIIFFFLTPFVFILNLFFKLNLFYFLVYSILFSLKDLFYGIELKNSRSINAFLINIIPNLLVLFFLVFLPQYTTIYFLIFTPLIPSFFFLIRNYKLLNFRFKSDYYKELLFFNGVITFSSIPLFLPMIFLTGKLDELAFFTVASGMNILVLKVTRVIGVTAYKDFENSDIVLSKEIILLSLMIFVAVLCGIPFLKYLITFFYGLDFLPVYNVAIPLLFSSILLPANSRIEVWHLTKGFHKRYLYLSVGISFIFILCLFFYVNALIMSYLFLGYRILLFLFGLYSKNLLSNENI